MGAASSSLPLILTLAPSHLTVPLLAALIPLKWELTTRMEEAIYLIHLQLEHVLLLLTSQPPLLSLRMLRLLV